MMGISYYFRNGYLPQISYWNTLRIIIFPFTINASGPNMCVDLIHAAG